MVSINTDKNTGSGERKVRQYTRAQLLATASSLGAEIGELAVRISSGIGDCDDETLQLSATSNKLARQSSCLGQKVTRTSTLARMTSSPLLKHHKFDARRQTSDQIGGTFKSLSAAPVAPEATVLAKSWRTKPTTRTATGGAYDSMLVGASLASQPLSLPYIPNDAIPVTELSPVRRIVAPDSLTEESVDPDNFDISSLVNITVLSDIKSLRREPVITQSHGNPSRRSFLERTVSGAGNYRHSGTSRGLFGRAKTDLGSDKGWQPPVRRHLVKLAATTAAPPETSDDAAAEREKEDKNVAQIIKAFKEQVRARALEAAAESAGQKSSETKTEPAHKMLLMRSKSTLGTKKNLDESLVREEASEALQTQEPSNTKVESQKDMKTESEKENSKPLVSQKPSNIPRFVSGLSRIAVPVPKPDVAQKSSIPSTASKILQKSFSRPPIVSEYKLLRGKSLKDEIGSLPTNNSSNENRV